MIPPRTPYQKVVWTVMGVGLVGGGGWAGDGGLAKPGVYLDI